MLAVAAAGGVAAGALLSSGIHYGLFSSSAKPKDVGTLQRARLAHRATDKLDASILDEQLSRNKLYFGEDGQQALQDALVVVVGLGGVGSHAANMMLRAGVGQLRLIDFDNLTLSSLNRHAVGTRDDVGRPKVEVCQHHFADIFPNCRVQAINQMFDAEHADELLAGRPTYVIDAIDDVNTKTDLVLACTRLGLKVISALGAGAKSDPTKVNNIVQWLYDCVVLHGACVLLSILICVGSSLCLSLL